MIQDFSEKKHQTSAALGASDEEILYFLNKELKVQC